MVVEVAHLIRQLLLIKDIEDDHEDFGWTVWKLDNYVSTLSIWN